jgi:hypothetical protein
VLPRSPVGALELDLIRMVPERLSVLELISAKPGSLSNRKTSYWVWGCLLFAKLALINSPIGIASLSFSALRPIPQPWRQIHFSVLRRAPLAEQPLRHPPVQAPELPSAVSIKARSLLQHPPYHIDRIRGNGRTQSQLLFPSWGDGLCSFKQNRRLILT